MLAIRKTIPAALKILRTLTLLSLDPPTSPIVIASLPSTEVCTKSPQHAKTLLGKPCWKNRVAYLDDTLKFRPKDSYKALDAAPKRYPASAP